MLLMLCLSPITSFFFFNAPATTEIYTLSLHDALPISVRAPVPPPRRTSTLTLPPSPSVTMTSACPSQIDRKSTRLNSSHVSISYAVFCLKKKKKKKNKMNSHHRSKDNHTRTMSSTYNE